MAKLLGQMKLVLQGTQGLPRSFTFLSFILLTTTLAETDVSPEQVSQLVTSIIQEDLLHLLARSIHLLPFESRKDTQTIFSYVLRFKPPNAAPTSEPPALAYVINQRPEVIVELCRGYEHRESAMPCGVVLREALKHESVATIIIHDQSQGDEKTIRLEEIDVDEIQSGDGVFWKFFPWIDGGAFEVSTDAFTTFRVSPSPAHLPSLEKPLTHSRKDILTRHKPLTSHYLTINFPLFFTRYNTILIQSPSYVTKRQSIKLLGELLLDRSNYNVMTEYVDRGEHLKLCMNLLKDDRKMVQYEGFHVFKVFVANPNKSPEVRRILGNNRERLLAFLPKFLEDRTDDEQFTDEKSFLIRQIEMMPSNAPPAAG